MGTIMILVTGAHGFVGNKIMEECKNVIASPSLRGMTEDDVKRMIEESGVDTIIHTAAISDIGTCQRDPEASYTANVLLPVYLAKASKNIKLICFSSDQVYSGSDEEGPFTEDMIKPGNTYAEHKIEMEQRVLDIAPDAVMLRAEWMYDCHPDQHNYFMWMKNTKDEVCVSSDEYRCVTYVKEVADNMESVIRLPGGSYNFGSETQKSFYEITKDFMALLSKNNPIKDVPRDRNLWVNCEKARKGGVIFSSVEDGLKKCAKDHKLID